MILGLPEPTTVFYTADTANRLSCVKKNEPGIGHPENYKKGSA